MKIQKSAQFSTTGRDEVLEIPDLLGHLSEQDTQ